jgi:magnesium chelatase subunit D
MNLPMTLPLFPFTALVGLDSLKLALQLAAVDGHLSVLARGDKGAGKTTAARALGALMGEAAPFINLPVGATEDRLLGGLDIERAMKGEPALKPGVLAQAHGGVLYIDEVNLLPDHLADALLDAVASGVHVLERDGFSAAQESQFVLVGSMNPEEGRLRPQLLDRFALAVDVSAPMDGTLRREVVERRLSFDADAARFVQTWAAEQQTLAARLALARKCAPAMPCPTEVLDYVANAMCARGVRSLRADLALVRASRALAALERAQITTTAHVDTVLPLVLAHRASAPPVPPHQPPHAPPPAPPSFTPDGVHGHGEKDAGAADHERIFGPVDVRVPRIDTDIVAAGSTAGSRTAAEAEAAARRGVVSHARLATSTNPDEVDVRASMVYALTRTGSPAPQREDLHEKVRTPVAGRRLLFVVDASGSQAAQQRMRFVKGAVRSILEESTRHRDEVAVIAFRGAQASLVLAPTKSLDEARAAMAYLPTGGRTPLAHGLEMASTYVTDDTMLILLTDGRANVPSHTDDPWTDAMRAASALRCPSLVIDSGAESPATSRARQLADALGATHIRLDALAEASITSVLPLVSPR